MPVKATIISGLLVISSVAIAMASEPDQREVVRWHLDFDSMEFLEDDFSHQIGTMPLERRKLRLIPGPFGSALHNDNPFRPKDVEQASMSVMDLDTLLEVVAFHRFQSLLSKITSEPGFV